MQSVIDLHNDCLECMKCMTGLKGILYTYYRLKNKEAKSDHIVHQERQSVMILLFVALVSINVLVCHAQCYTGTGELDIQQ